MRGYIDRMGLKYLWPEKICNKSGRSKEGIIRMIPWLKPISFQCLCLCHLANSNTGLRQCCTVVADSDSVDTFDLHLVETVDIAYTVVWSCSLAAWEDIGHTTYSFDTRCYLGYVSRRWENSFNLVTVEMGLPPFAWDTPIALRCHTLSRHPCIQRMLSSKILPYGHHCTDYHLNYPLARSFHYKGLMVVHLETQTILVAMNTKWKSSD